MSTARAPRAERPAASHMSAKPRQRSARGDGAAHSPSPVVIDGYTVLSETLGVGSHSKVKLGRDAAGSPVAVKRIALRHHSPTELATELEALAQLRGVPGVVQLLAYREDDRKRYGYMVLDHHPKDLYTYLCERQRLPEPEVRLLFGQIVRAVQCCHAAGICHRDLKLENILISSDAARATLADFGLAAVDAAGQRMEKFCGSPFTVSPEIIARVPYTMATDVWSLGVLLYAMVAGRFPFRHRDPTRLFQSISRGAYEMPSDFSPRLVDLLQHILVLDVSKRYALDDILAHEWMTTE